MYRACVTLDLFLDNTLSCKNMFCTSLCIKYVCMYVHPIQIPPGNVVVPKVLYVICMDARMQPGLILLKSLHAFLPDQLILKGK